MPEANEADWMPSSIVEREAEWRKLDLARHDRLALTLGPLLSVAAFAAGTFLTYWLFGTLASVAVGIPLFFAPFLVAYRVDQRRARLEAEAIAAEEILKDEFGAGEGWFVDLLVHQNTAPTGVDTGMIWFEEGRLLFSGHRTSFAISPDQVRGSCETVDRIAGLRHSILLPLKTDVGAPELSISLGPRSKSDLDKHRLERAIDEWATSATRPKRRLTRNPTNADPPASTRTLRVVEEPPVDEAIERGQLPPTKIGPGAPTPAQLLRRATLSTVYWLFLSWATLQTPTDRGKLLMVFLGVVVGTILRCWYPGTRWQAWKDSRSLPR